MRIVFFTLLLGCTVAELDLEGRECPCIDGWTCDDATNTCVRDADDADLPDASRDVGREDASRDSSVDAGPDTSAPDAGPDAGPTDAGDATDAPADVPPDTLPPPSTECDDLDVLFCEGFEDDLSQWGVDFPTGTETGIVFGPDALKGRGMLRSYVEGREGISDYSLISARVWPDDTNDLWIRVHYYFDSALAAPTEMFEIFNTGYDYSVPHLVSPGAYTDIHAHNVFMDMSWSTPARPETDRWICTEMHMHRHPTNGFIELFIDRASAINTGSMPIVEPFNELSVGIVYAESEGVIFIDEVAADTNRIPCP